MATQFDFSNLGSMFSGGMGGTPSGLDALLSEDQRKLMGRNAALSAAAALLQAGGRNPQRIGLGQALGSALQAGQQGYQQARAGSLQDMLLTQKLEEAKRAEALRKQIADVMTTAPQLLNTAQAALAAPGMPLGPTNQRAELMDSMPQPTANELKANQYQTIADIYAAQGKSEDAKRYQEIAEKLNPRPEALPENIRTLKALNLPVTLAGLRQLDKPEASPAEVKLLQAAGMPVTLDNIMQIRRSGASNVSVKVPVDMTGGQKGFENEMKLGGAFKQEPIYKDFSDMKSAYGQVVSSLAQGTPIGDVAGATKVMKLLDPGSVVRESELGIAMAAAGRMDRLQNYFNNLMTGEKLTPTQRDDFQRLSNELYAAAGQAYNKKRDEYKQFGDAYNFKNLDTALGAPATVPSNVKPSSAAKTMQWDGTKFVFK